MPNFHTPQPITATIEIATGTVRLVASERTDTVVEVRPRDKNRSQDVKVAEQVRVDFRNGSLSVLSHRGFAFPRRGAVVVDVALPSGSRLHASVVSAQLTADGEYADCTLASVSGDVAVEAAAENVKVDNVSGGISVGVAKKSASVSTVSGDATFGKLRGDIKFQAASGSLTVGRLEGKLNAQTASGDVTVTTAVNGGVSVQSSSGELVLGIAEGTAAQLDLRTKSGEVRNSLTSSDGPASGDETLVVHARTGSGDIVVQRASAEAMS